MWVILVVILLSLLYFLLSKKYNYWKEKGVPGPKPHFIVGNIGPSLIGKKSLGDIFTEIYRKYEAYPFVGIFRTSTPCLLIRDLEMVKKIVVKDFAHFQDNDIEVDKDVDKIAGRNPFFLKGNEWKQKRAVLTSCFTSGKMKGMFPMLEEISNRMVKYVEDNSSTCLESREICIRYTLDNVAACAFGLEGRSFAEEYSDFRELADKFLSPGTWRSFLLFFSIIFPKMGRILKIGFINKNVEKRLIEMVTSTLKHRRDNNIVRNDFLEYVSELVATSDVFDDEIDVVAQAATFFGDGYETSSRVMSFILFALACHPNVQYKLRGEIESVTKKYNGNVTYEAVQEMDYLDACINETMRIYPIVAQLFKKCTEEYTYTPENPEYKKITVTIEEGTCIILPLAGLQSDEKYFPNPDKFDPERFMDKERPKYAFLPFGEGPRMCLGMRFALLQIKLGVAQLVKNFRMSVNQKTQLPLKYDPWYIMIHPIGGLWIDFKRIAK